MPGARGRRASVVSIAAPHAGVVLVVARVYVAVVVADTTVVRRGRLDVARPQGRLVILATTAPLPGATGRTLLVALPGVVLARAVGGVGLPEAVWGVRVRLRVTRTPRRRAVADAVVGTPRGRRPEDGGGDEQRQEDELELQAAFELLFRHSDLPLRARGAEK